MRNRGQHTELYVVLIFLTLILSSSLFTQDVKASAQIFNETLKATYFIPENHHQLLQNELAVLHTREIEQTIVEYGVKLLACNNSRRNDLITEWLNKFGKVGVPLNVFIYLMRKNRLFYQKL